MTSSDDKHLRAYEKMLNHARELLTDAKQEVSPRLEKVLDAAREKASEVEELSREELDKISNYLRRDMYDVANFMAEDRGELRDWLRFDIEQVEERILESLSHLVDPTNVDLAEFREQAELFGEWHTGEITGPGTLVCDACGEELHFHKTGHIPPCPKCKATKYHRNFEQE
ncbi:zinc ribbon-containing protein [Kaarinaea lacus]